MAQTITDEQLAILNSGVASDAKQVAVEAWAADMKIETASPRRGRAPIKVGAVAGKVGAEVVEMARAAAPAIAEIRANTVSMPRAELAQSLHLAKTVGSIAAFQFNEAINRVAALKAFAEIRESKAYKGLRAQNETTGDIVVVETWEEFCNAYGFSKNKINEDLQNLAIFGGGLLEMQESLGLGYRDLRLLRKGIAQLPPEERQAILDEVQNAEGPEELKDRLADLRAELAGAKADKEKLRSDIEAKEKLSKAKSERLDNLEEQINRLTSMSPDERQKSLDEINARARADVDKACQDAFVAAIALCSQCAAVFRDERSGEDVCAYVHERVGLLMNNIADAVLGAGVDVDLRQRFELPGDDAESVPETSAEPETADTHD